jgi:hypothetical protein
MEEMRNTFKILAENDEDKRQLLKPRHRYLDNINIDLREVGMTGFLLFRTRARSWGSSVSIVFVYRLEFDPRQKLRFFCIFFVQTGYKTNPASCTMGTGALPRR